MKIDDLFGDYYDPNRKKKLDKYAEEMKGKRSKGHDILQRIVRFVAALGHITAVITGEHGNARNTEHRRFTKTF